MAGTLRNIQPGQVVPVHMRDGSMRCMTKVVNPTGRSRYKGKFVCNSACGLPTKRPSKRCGMGGMMQPSMQRFLPQQGF